MADDAFPSDSSFVAQCNYTSHPTGITLGGSPEICHMSLAELLPQIQELSQSDKQKLMLLLQRDLPESTGQDVLIAGQEYLVWSPYNCSEAANTLMNLLETKQQNG
jgi:hypothetical protein